MYDICSANFVLLYSRCYFHSSAWLDLTSWPRELPSYHGYICSWFHYRRSPRTGRSAHWGCQARSQHELARVSSSSEESLECHKSRTHVEVCDLVVLDVLDQAIGATDSSRVSPVVRGTVRLASVVALATGLATVRVARDVVFDILPPSRNVVRREGASISACWAAVHHAVVVHGDLLVVLVAKVFVVHGVPEGDLDAGLAKLSNERLLPVLVGS